MAYQNLFEALQNICSFTALESEMFEIIDAYEKDKVKQLSQADVSGRSELLIAFGKFIDEDCDLLGNGYIEEMVKKFEVSNSH